MNIQNSLRIFVVFLLISIFSMEVVFAQDAVDIVPVQDNGNAYTQSENYSLFGTVGTSNILDASTYQKGFFEEILESIKEFLAQFNEAVVNAAHAFNEVHFEAGMAMVVFAGLASILAGISNTPLALPAFEALKNIGYLLGWTKRKKPWGFVFDQATKQPIAGAKVQVFDADSGRLLETQLTDDKGHFELLVQAGTYTVSVSKDGYITPKSIVEGYRGEVLNFSSESELRLNVPLEINTKEVTFRSKWISAVRAGIDDVRIPLLVLGTALEGALFAVYMRPIDALMLALYIALWTFQIHEWLKRSSTGIVLDESNHPLSLSLVRAINLPDRSIVATRVTNAKGTYSIRLNHGEYEIVATKTGYLPKKVNIKIGQGKIVDEKLYLKKQ